MGVSDRRRCRRALRRRGSNRPRRSSSDSLDARLDRCSRRSDASSRNGLQGRDRPRSRPHAPIDVGKSGSRFARAMMTLRRDHSLGAGRPRRAKPAVAATVGLAVCTLVACGGGKTATQTRDATQKTASSCPTTGKQVTFPLLDKSKAHTVNVLTNLGSFDIRLDVGDSPCTTSSFAALVRKHFFDGTRFHRIVPGFVIQGGDPTATGRGGPGYSVRDVPPRNSLYTEGVVAMAKSAAEPSGTSGSQFFVVTSRERRPTARVRDPRRRHQGIEHGQEDRHAGQPGDREADAAGCRAAHARHAVA